MQELIKKIEQWAEYRNIINGSKPIDQAMKLFSEFGELADNVGKGRDCRDDIGDVFVVLTIMAKQYGLDIGGIKKPETKCGSSLKYKVSYLCSGLSSFSNSMDEMKYLEHSIWLLHDICLELGHTLQECVQIAYNDIKDRKGVTFNGTFIKDTDPAYNEALQKLGKA